MNPTVEESIGNAAIKIASDIKANCIVTINRHLRENKGLNDILPYTEIKVNIFKGSEHNFKQYSYITEISRTQINPITFIKRLLIKALNHSYISKGDRVVFVEDRNVTSYFMGALYVFDIDELFFNITKTAKLLEGVNVQVIEAVTDLALEIADEGREGKKVGTAFIIRNNEPIDKYTKQLIINPFEKEDRKITDYDIKEGIKEFSQLDGVFVIDKDGRILSVGTYIDINSSLLNLPFGMGTRHKNCAALTKETDAVAVVVSESGGVVRVFKNGQMVMRLP
ncbi:MAG: diadenylate cyclase [Nanoarchaeota archaeon]